MPEVVGIKFRQCGKVYDFDAEGLSLKPGDVVVVDSDMGLSLGKVVSHCSPTPEKEYKKVLRVATGEDRKEEQANADLCQEAFAFCRERIMARGLEMKLIRTESTLDRKRLVFYFVSDKRIDFRELVKDMAQKFRTRIEMRQVGVRDEAKMTGGLGLCGRKLCCSEFLVDFAPISIKMAKKQDLILNTGKLSGVCGRLMCCLGYEYNSEKCCRKGAAAGESAEEAGMKETSLEEAALNEAFAETEAAGPAVEEFPSKEKTEEKPAGSGQMGRRRWPRDRRGAGRNQGQNQQGPVQRREDRRPDNKLANRPGHDNSEEKPAHNNKPQAQTGLHGGPQKRTAGEDGQETPKDPEARKKRRWRKRGRRNRNNSPGPNDSPGSGGEANQG
ncbi:MAG: regulatory iron-sulfur-containing complex subunit RicT [Actinomycetota bacterium]|nr:regulatory iron-sulfur-containing complex subunit RicT [Actinomycetota bacterium]